MAKEYKPYWEKLRDPRWQKKRLEIMERDDWACRDCSGRNATLHVHHNYYTYGKQPWEYPDSALVTLCDGCHEKRHGRAVVADSKPEPPATIEWLINEFNLVFLSDGKAKKYKDGVHVKTRWFSYYLHPIKTIRGNHVIFIVSECDGRHEIDIAFSELTECWTDRQPLCIAYTSAFSEKGQSAIRENLDLLLKDCRR
jgi:hypothetical protein